MFLSADFTFDFTLSLNPHLIFLALTTKIYQVLLVTVSFTKFLFESKDALKMLTTITNRYVHRGLPL